MTTFSGNVTLGSAYTVPAGTVDVFNPNVSTTVETDFNFIVNGTLRMRPANPNVVHTLRFTNVNEANFVGGGIVVIPSDVGLWIMGDGVWDAVGTPKAGWNRTGDDPTWLASDEMYRTPWNVGDYSTCVPHVKGTTPNSIVGPDGVTYRQEVFNVTRNVRVEGTPPTGTYPNLVYHRSHIFIHSHVPQTIKYVLARYMGPLQGPHNNNSTVLGRYAFHTHHSFEHSRGSLYEGCVARDYGSRAFVPHMSDGITQRDCIAFDGRDIGAYWWDLAQPTNDLLWEHCLSVKNAPEIPGTGRKRTGAFTLGSSSLLVSPNENIIRDCAVAGFWVGGDGSGYLWPEIDPEDTSHPDAVRTAGQNPSGIGRWDFEDCTAHNCAAHGIFVWQNTTDPFHLVDHSAFWRNGKSGITHGAYLNRYSYKDQIVFENGLEDFDYRSNTGPQVMAVSDPNPPYLRYVRTKGFTANIGHHRFQSILPAQSFWCEFNSLEVGEPTVESAMGHNEFICCNLEPTDLHVNNMRPDSICLFQRPNGTAFQLNSDGTTTVIPQFAPYPIFLGDLDTGVMGSVNIELLTGGTTVTPTGIVTGLAFGTLEVSGSVMPTGIATGLAFGNPTVTTEGVEPPPEEPTRAPLRLRTPDSVLRGA